MGVDLVPFKTCTYDCVYCQLGRTTTKTVERRAYVSAEAILAEIRDKLASDPLGSDYIGVAGSGEPTLNSEIGQIIRGIKDITSVPVAVLTNGSLLWMAEVQDALMAADVVLPSLDAGNSRLFRRVNRPHPDISFEQMVDGLISFTKGFPGEVWLEVLLVAGVTGTRAEVEKIAALIDQVGPRRIQLNTVSRPPVEESALSLSRSEMQSLAALLRGTVDIIAEHGDMTRSDASHVSHTEASAAAAATACEADILALLSRRPCTVRDVASGLGMHVNEAVKELDALRSAGKVNTTGPGPEVFYTVVYAMDDSVTQAQGRLTPGSPD